MFLMLLACTDGGAFGDSVVSEDSAALAASVSTVIEVSFTLSASAAVAISYTPGGGDTASTPIHTLDAGDHMIRVLGVPAATEVSWAVSAVDADGRANYGAGGSLRTGNLPSSVPTLDIANHLEAYTDENWLVGAALLADGTDVQFVADRDGEVVWYHETSPELISPWAEPGRDGQGGLLVNSLQEDFCTDQGRVTRFDMSGEESEVTLTPEGHHAFVQHEDGTIAYIARDLRDHADFVDPVCGDKVVEIAPDGTSTVLFTSWDHYDVSATTGMQSDHYCDCLDWTHGNMLAWNPSTDSYLLSFSNINTIVEFDRDSGDVLRQFGDEDGSYGFDPQGAWFSRQHGGHYTADGNLLLTQTNGTSLETTAFEYAVDDDARNLRLDWSYGTGEGFYAPAMGEAHRLANLNTLVNFGSSGAMVEVTPLGEIVWEASLDVGTMLGRTTLIDDIYSLDPSP